MLKNKRKLTVPTFSINVELLFQIAEVPKSMTILKL